MSNDKLAEALRSNIREAMNSGVFKDDTRRIIVDWYNQSDAIIKNQAAEAAQAQAQAAEPVAWTRQDVISDDGGCPIGMDEPRIAWGAECPDYEGGWAPLYTRPQPAQDAKDAAIPLKGWIFDKVDMGRGDERYICTPDGSNATTVRNETTSDHHEQMLWLIADAMAKESGR